MSILEIKGLCKCFDKTEVLKGVNFSMEEGEVVSIIGSSGSGKTTLLRCINFLERAEKGQIMLDGKLLFDGDSERSASAKEIRKKQLNFGLVFQDFNLFPQYNVLDNVMLAPKLLAKERPDYKANKKEIHDEIRKNAEAILARVGLSDKLDSYPCQLSGGQKQRVSIATQKITMVIVTHEIDFAEGVSDKVIFMADGVVVEEGTPDEVLNNPKNERTRAFLQKLGDK